MAEPFFDGNVLALVKNGIVQDFFADFNSLENDLVGSIFIGEVDRISKDLNSSFIKLPFNKMGFLKGIRNLLVEGGDKLTGNILKNRLVNQFYLFKSPKNLSKINKYVSFTSNNILKDKYRIKAKIISNLAKDNITIYKR